MLLHLAWRRNLDGFDLALAANRVTTAAPVPAQPPEPKTRFPAVVAVAAEKLPLPGDSPFGALAAMVRDDLGDRLKSVAARLEAVEAAFAALDPPAPAIRYLWARCEAAALTALAAERECSLTERLAEIEIPLVLAEAWCCLAEGERHLGRIDGPG